MAPEPTTTVFVGDLEVPRGLPDALARFDAAAEQPLLRQLELVDADGALAPELRPVAGCIAYSQLTLSLALRHGPARVDARGWLDRGQAVLAIPESPDGDAGLRLLCFPTVHLAYRLAVFLGLGPRPLREDSGAAVMSRTAFEEIVGSGLEAGQARKTMGVDDPDAEALLAPLCRNDGMHWRIVLADSATDGATFVREAEAVDGSDEGLWLVGPAGEAERVVVAPATATQAWRLLSTLLPTQAETEAVVAAQVEARPGSRSVPRRSGTDRRRARRTRGARAGR